MTILLIALCIAAYFTLYVDYRQTMRIAADVRRWDEVGFARYFIGKDPTRARVNIYYATWALIYAGLAVATYWEFLPQWVLVGLAIIGTVIEGRTVYRNRKIGLGWL